MLDKIHPPQKLYISLQLPIKANYSVVIRDISDAIIHSKSIMNKNLGRTTFLGSPHLPSKGVGSEFSPTWGPNTLSSKNVSKNPVPQKIADLPSLKNQAVLDKHPKPQKKWDLHLKSQSIETRQEVRGHLQCS